MWKKFFRWIGWSPPQKRKRTENERRVNALIREIRATAQYLDKFLEETTELAGKLDSTGRARLMDERLGVRMQERINEPISRSLEEADEIFLTGLMDREWCSDELQMIKLKWSRVMDLWPDAVFSFDQQRSMIEQSRVYLDEIVFHCAGLTLSPRINDTLINLRVGQPLDWDFRFGSELPRTKEFQHRLLQEMAQEGGVLDAGVVDVEQRMIYRIAETRQEQRNSVIKMVALVVVSGIVVPYVLFWIIGRPYPFVREVVPLYATFAMLFLGVGAHVAIDAIKAARAQTRPNFQVINDWILWLHMRETSILWSLAWVLLGYIVLTFAMPGMSWRTAFFVGYSLDSVLGIFLMRFETVAKTRVKELTAEKNAT